jgi:hypothetical protein
MSKLARQLKFYAKILSSPSSVLQKWVNASQLAHKQHHHGSNAAE